ncbi:MAG: hypothetical protein DMF54_15960 [Acidobacteria bacterium]|nr:MAG: hypothetical protein DMF54_15960 [Acidobacteriota bacterium]
MFILLSRLGRLLVGTTVVIAVTGFMGFNTLTTTPVASKHKDPPCTISPSTVAVNQAYTISATRLPTIDPVYLIVTPPSGSSSVTPVPVSSTGTWSGIESSGLAGTWTYTFSGLQTNNTYGAVATCSAHVI